MKTEREGKMFKPFTGRWVAAFAALLLTALPVTASAKDNVTTVISTTGFVYLPLFVAEQLGYFQQEGIEPTIVVTGGEAKSLAAILSNGADIFLGTPGSALRTRANGTDVKTIGAVFTQYGSNVVVSRDWALKKGITEASTFEARLAALQGATIGVTAIGSGTDMLVRYLAKKASLNADRDLTITGVGTGDAALAALSQNRIQGFSLASPAGEFAVYDQKAFMLFNLTAGYVKDLDGFLYIAVNARDSWLTKNTDLAVRYLKAIQRALHAIHDKSETATARDAVWKKYHNKIDKTLYDYIWSDSINSSPKSVEINSSMMTRVLDFMNEFEKPKLDTSALSGAWSDDYAKRATAKQ
jgi:NitT/TauT family transport system substrate-binding protein